MLNGGDGGSVKTQLSYYRVYSVDYDNNLINTILRQLRFDRPTLSPFCIKHNRDDEPEKK